MRFNINVYFSLSKLIPVGGLLSALPSENPYWYNANHVFVPYCSSDSWSGTKVRPDTRDGLRFMGSLIVRQVMSDLVPLGLGHSQGADLLMAGSSAGGLGVMLNLDKVRTFLQNERGKIPIRNRPASGAKAQNPPKCLQHAAHTARKAAVCLRCSDRIRFCCFSCQV